MRLGLTSGNLSLTSSLVISKQQKIGRRSVATVGGGQNQKNTQKNREIALTHTRSKIALSLILFPFLFVSIFVGFLFRSNVLPI
jgi:hypothetical protein